MLLFMIKLKIEKKIQIQFLEHRVVIRPCIENINKSTFFGLSFKLKNLGKTLTPTRDVIL